MAGLLAILTFIIGLGSVFGRFSPYEILFSLPGFELMQISTRWFGWTTFFLLLSIGLFRASSKFINVLLVLGILSLFIANRPLLSVFKYEVQLPKTNQSFEQYDKYAGYAPETSSMFLATLHNYGEIRGYEPMLDYNINRPTKRCGINNGCSFISPNGKVDYWSPNKIIISRLDKGPIELNLNPSSYWLVNGKRIFNSSRAAELNERFIINDPQEKIELSIRPL